MNADLPDQLAARLRRPLPGWAAQSRFQPELSFGRHLGPPPANAKPAAVLALLYPCQGQWHLPLIVRPQHMPAHAGQVSLPGGVIEAGEDSRQAALRECAEELGVDAPQIQVLGRLTPLYLFASNFQVEPWVGALDAPPPWCPSRDEVDRLLEVPVTHFLDRDGATLAQRRQRGLSFAVPCYQWQSECIWGATSMILAELAASLEELPL